MTRLFSMAGRRTFFAGILLMAALPLGYTPGRGITTTRGNCQNGTCCPELGAICVVGDIQVKNYYYKDSGSCKQPPPDM